MPHWRCLRYFALSWTRPTWQAPHVRSNLGSVIATTASSPGRGGTCLEKPSGKSLPFTELHEETLRIWFNNSALILSIDEGVGEISAAARALILGIYPGPSLGRTLKVKLCPGLPVQSTQCTWWYNRQWRPEKGKYIPKPLENLSLRLLASRRPVMSTDRKRCVPRVNARDVNTQHKSEFCGRRRAGEDSEKQWEYTGSASIQNVETEVRESNE
ncbi:hypothetical protein ARMSODRAFT_976861 [Armillaria solidipes]|uniref:Uncharacterized protein n=1 Tax=Armillaria solidipes TaxID=1076256 RepID=A0A2H3BVR8_9AGAR|nr:hypothetical protein ARMSODRAFT_976861 [Armillaria solidipes]